MFQNLLGGMMGGLEAPGRPFNFQLRAFSAPFFQGYDAEKVEKLNYSGKILLPPSALDWLVRLNIEYPMMFRLTNANPEAQRCTHAGVLEFLAEEGKCYCPSWMMQQLRLQEGEVVQVEYRNLPSATFAKFQPQSVDFLDISNPRAMLEYKLREFSCLTKNDKIQIHYNDRTLEVVVKELRPADAASIVEVDMNVEFDAPEGYVDPSIKKKQEQEEAESSSNRVAPTIVSQKEVDGFMPFMGEGVRLDGKNKSSKQLTQLAEKAKTTADGTADSAAPVIVTPNNDYKPGSLNFVRNYIRRDQLLAAEQERAAAEQRPTAQLGRSGPSQASLNDAALANVKAFSGAGRSLRDRK